MNGLFTRFTAVFAALAFVFSVAGSATAQRQSDRQVRDLVRTLSSQVDGFHYTLEDQLRSSSADPQDIDDANRSVANLQDKVTAFEDNLNERRENRDDVNEIVAAARDIDAFFIRERPNQRILRDWNAIKSTIARLAANYGVTPNASGRVSAPPPYRNNYPTRTQNNYPTRTQTPATSSSELTGTYRLDRSRSENTDQILSETNLGGEQRQDLQKKLEAPEQIAIDIRGNEVTLASSIASPVSFIADGSEKTERDTSGRTVRLRATIRGQELTISSLGGESDYTIIFTPTDGGRSLKVTRRITTEYLRQTVFADSVYEKTDDIAGLGINSSDRSATTGGWSSTNNGNAPAISPGRTGEFIVPNGTIMSGFLENTIDTQVSQNNDRFKLTVQSPMEFRGAVIEGYISGVGRSGRISGRSNVTFNFERITLRDGRSYDFAGSLQSIKDQNGKVIKVDTEGTAKSGSQTRETVKRGGIGAGLGAIIGAIAGGGTGAAVGAVIGGSVGAGSVVVQGRDDIQLLKGSTITVQASSPIRGSEPPVDN